MDYSSILLGLLITLYGIYITVKTINSPDKLIKLQFMKDKLGLTAGVVIHTIAYVIIPIIFGIALINAGSNGISITQFWVR